MELTISVSEQAGHILQNRAKANGRDVNEFVKELVENQALSPTLEELLAPVREEISEKGITEDELDEFIYSLRDKIREENKTD